MVSVDVPPFRTIGVGPDTVTFPPPEVEGLPWEPAASIRLSADVAADTDQCRDRAGLPAGTPLLAVLEVWCDNTYWSDHSAAQLPEGTGTVTLRVSTPPGALYGKLGHKRYIALAADVGHGLADVAQHRGSTLVSSPNGTVHLSGDGGQFPTEVADFAKSGLIGDARWSLRFRHESPEDPVLGTVSLMLNETSPAVRILRGQEEAPEQVSRLIGRELRRFVVAEIIRQALADEQLVSDFDWPDHSVGDLMVGVVERFAGGRSVDELRTLAQRDRERFEMLLQGAVPDVR